MERLETYEQYSAVLAEFKQDRPRCATNKLLMRDELTALIDAGKLYCEQLNDTLWFFSDEGYFYTAQVYVPAGSGIEIEKQDKDVLVELMGNESRYPEQLEHSLLEAGFEKHDKYVEFACQPKEVIGTVEKNLTTLRKFWGEQGFICRKAVRADYPELRRLWMEQLGWDRYNVLALTDAELDEMERYGRCIVICDPKGRIAAASNYIKKGSICYTYITATYIPGLGGWASNERFLSAYSEGCTKEMGWIRDDNHRSIGMARWTKKPSGKFFWQFLLRAKPQ